MDLITAANPRFDIADVSTLPPPGTDTNKIKEKAKELGKQLDRLEELLYAAGTHSLLIVLQGMDTSGKDGTIRNVLSYCNAQGCRIAPFKVPTPEELAHDFLWRVHKQTPGKGEFVFFNRSHYEDVLVVRFLGLIPEAQWRLRYERINEFEQLLAESGTIVRKFFLHVSKEEQEQRLLEREEEVEKAWKLSPGDWKTREQWDEYQAAYSEAIGRCASPDAPWVVVPADKKWYRDFVVIETLVSALAEHESEWLARLDKIGEEAKAELAEYRAGS